MPPALTRNTRRAEISKSSASQYRPTRDRRELQNVRLRGSGEGWARGLQGFSIMTARGIRAQVEGAYRRFALAARVWEGVRTRADERRGEAGSVGCSWRIAAKVAALCCDDFAAVYTVSNGGGSERAGWEEVGGFGGEAVGVEIRVWSGWEEREKQRLSVCSRRQVRRVGQ